MTARGEALRGRRRAERLMLDQCTITRDGSDETTDPATGVVTRTTTTIYTGICKVQARALQARNPDAGEVQWALSQIELHVPMTATGIRTGDIATITASIDPDLVGKTLRVTIPAHKTFTTARRLPCTEGGPW